MEARLFERSQTCDRLLLIRCTCGHDSDILCELRGDGAHRVERTRAASYDTAAALSHASDGVNRCKTEIEGTFGITVDMRGVRRAG